MARPSSFAASRNRPKSSSAAAIGLGFFHEIEQRRATANQVPMKILREGGIVEFTGNIARLHWVVYLARKIEVVSSAKDRFVPRRPEDRLIFSRWSFKDRAYLDVTEASLYN
ncbi:hypothetical protein KM043_004146 [Ampulex compressa]|nr:hypothetical protein KM043_004146 [Ampulex compressa]